MPGRFINRDPKVESEWNSNIELAETIFETMTKKERRAWKRRARQELVGLTPRIRKLVARDYAVALIAERCQIAPIILSDRDRDLFLEMLADTSPPNKQLLDTVEHHKRVVGTDPSHEPGDRP